MRKVIGHHSVIALIEQLLKRGQLPHGLLFAGPPAVGKRLVARLLASRILGPDSGKLVSSGTHPDLHLLQLEPEKKDISVDAIRTLISKLHLKSYFGVAKVAIIDDAHRLSLAASNALLMTLEEPTPNTYLFLVTHAPHRLPQTILSRCQLLNFSELERAEGEQIICDITENGLEGAEVNELLNLTGGSFDALSIDSFIDPLTLEVSNSKAMNDHLREVVSNYNVWNKKLESLIRKDTPPGAAISLGTELAAMKESTIPPWQLVRRFVRTKLRDQPERVAWSSSLEEVIEGEALTTERNANPQLQLSSVLLSLWQETH